MLFRSITPGTHLSMSDFWRWWIIHLWVEGMFEVFAVVVLGLLLVSMGLVTRTSAARALKFQLFILLGSDIIGTGHHYYWIGATEFWIALGSIFSGLEVIPLTLLAVEAAERSGLHQRVGKQAAFEPTAAGRCQPDLTQGLADEGHVHVHLGGDAFELLGGEEMGSVEGLGFELERPGEHALGLGCAEPFGERMIRPVALAPVIR